MTTDATISQPCVMGHCNDCLEPRLCGCDCHRAPAAARRTRWWMLPTPARRWGVWR